MLDADPEVHLATAALPVSGRALCGLWVPSPYITTQYDFAGCAACVTIADVMMELDELLARA